MRVTIPIGGTVTRPRLNGRAFQAALSDATKEAAVKGLEKEAGKWLKKLLE